MTDGLSMDTEATSTALTQLGTAGSALQEGWATASSSIESFGGRLGMGPLGQAFAQGYRPAVEAVSTAMAKITPVPGQLAQAGQQHVANYGQVDSAARNRYSGL